MPAQAEVVSGPALLDEATIIYFESLVGPFDTSKLTTADAQRLTDFFLGKRRDVRKNSTNDQYHEPVLRYRLSNVSRGDIAIRIGRKPQDVSNILVGLRTMIHANYSIEQLAELLKKELSLELSSQPQLDQETVQADNADSVAPTVEVVEIVAQQLETQVDLVTPSRAVSPVPKPPTTPMPTIAKQVELQSQGEAPLDDVTTALVKALNITKESDIKKLQQLLSFNIKAAGEITQGEKNKIVYAIREQLRRKYGSFKATVEALQLSEGQRVAFANLLGWYARTDGQEGTQNAVLTAVYVHHEGNRVYEARKDAVKAVHARIATALSDPVRSATQAQTTKSLYQ